MLGITPKERALNRYLNQLPTDLAQRYGRLDYYTIGQLTRTLEDCHYTKRYRGYAKAMFLTRDHAISELKTESIYVAIRKEIADTYFEGNMAFIVVPKDPRSIGNDGHTSIVVNSIDGYSNT